MAFQYSGKKDDTSMKLRAQNNKNAQNETKSLERDSEKMEERLQELKLAMMLEKEQRDRSGNSGFWSRGQEGNLGNYATDVLTKPTKNKGNKESRIKVKVLKDEPTVVPERRAAPGTMAFIAKRGTDSASTKKIKGPKCGQCEQKGAHVSCLECGEDYCAGCFAAFHLKGALKKHRSVPLGQGGMRTPRSIGGGDIGKLTPRNANQRTNDTRATPTEGSTSNSIQSTPRHSARSGVTNGTQGNELLNGVYDESEAAAEFQRALTEWRQGKKQTNGLSPTQAKTSATEKTIQPKQRVNFAPQPTYNSAHCVEEGTGMDGSEHFDQKPLEIVFHSDLTYAEKLMLKRARRTELGAVTPSSGDSASNDSRVGSGYGPLRSAHSPTPSVTYSEVQVLNEGAIAMAELMETEPSRVDFGSLFGAVNRPAEEYEYEPIRSESRVSIIELADSVSRRNLRGVEQTSSYEVTEVQDGDEFTPPQPSQLAINHNANIHEKRFVPSPPPSASYSARRKRGQGQTVTSKDEAQDHNTASSKSARNTLTMKTSESAQVKDVTTSQTPRGSARQRTKQTNNPDLQQSMENISEALNQTSAISGKQSSRKSARQAPPSARSESARGQKSRPGSRTSGRPQSRAKSRAESRLSIFGEGNITKEPSEALKQIALLSREITSQIVMDSQSRLDLGDFFTAGVATPPPDPNVERTLTPRKNRPTSARPLSSRPKSAKQQDNPIEKWKISNKLYSITPRSWKPDFSLAETVPESQAQLQMQDTASYELMATQDSTLGGSDDWMAEEVAMASVQRLQASIEDNKPQTPSSSRPKSRGMWSAPQPLSRPVSRPSSAVQRPISARRECSTIVMEGEDLSIYDARGEELNQTTDDCDTLDQLEWELASQTGRLTADGRVSRMLDDTHDDVTPISDSELEHYTHSPDQGIDINNQLRESELMDDFEEMEKAINDEQDVQQLM